MLKLILTSMIFAVTQSTWAIEITPLDSSKAGESRYTVNWKDDGVRAVIHKSPLQSGRPAALVVYATPNGNTAEMTLGRTMQEGLDWHYDIQHIAAQHRMLQTLDKRPIHLAVIEAEGLSWPSWRSMRKDNGEIIRKLVDDIQKLTDAKSLILTGHSGGGSFIFGLINGSDAIPEYVERIAFLDANYGFQSGEGHGDKLLKWLKGGEERTLVTMAYDDRKIELDGKKVIKGTGGAWRASHRMIADFDKSVKLKTSGNALVRRYSTDDGKIQFILHNNPDNKILHTVMIGEMNGYLEAMTINTSAYKTWGIFAAPRVYGKFVE